MVSSPPPLTYSTLPWRLVGTWLLRLCVPACAVKQVVNVSQLASACQAVACQDARERNQKRQ